MSIRLQLPQRSKINVHQFTDEEIEVAALHEKTRNDLLEKLITNEVNSKKGSVQNAKALFSLLKHFTAFSNFILNNSFKSEGIIASLYCGKIKEIKKDGYLYRQGSCAKELYLLLKGEIVLKTIGSHQTKSEQSDKGLVNSITQGSFFGEWELLLSLQRSNSAQAIEDSVVIIFSKEIFNNYYQKDLIKCEIAKKSFIMNQIKAFKKIPLMQFDSYYKNFIKITPKLNDIIFTEGDSSEAFYLIYKGSCLIRKHDMNHPLLIHDKGDLIGLDGLFNQPSYQYSLYSLDGNTIIFKVLIRNLSETLIDSLVNELLPFYTNQCNTIIEFTKKHMTMQKNIVDSYENIFKKCPNKLNKTSQQEIEQIIDKTLNTMNCVKVTKKYKSKPKVLNKSIQNTFNLSSDKCYAFPMKMLKNKKDSDDRNKIASIPAYGKVISKLMIQQYTDSTPKTTPIKLLTSKTRNKRPNTLYMNSRDDPLYTSYHYHPNRTEWDTSNNNNKRIMTLTSSRIRTMTKTKTSADKTDSNSFMLGNSFRQKTMTKPITACNIYWNDRDRYKERMTFSEKVDDSIATWLNVTNNTTMSFQTKHFKIPLISLNKAPINKSTSSRNNHGSVYYCCSIDD